MGGGRRLLLPARWKVSDAIFWGLCRKPYVNAYWGASEGVERFHYIDNGDGTYTYYAINGNKRQQWWDRFVWYNSDNVIDFHVSPDAQIWETNNNRFNSQSVEAYDYGGKAIATKSLWETFYLCTKLKEVDISKWTVANCTDFSATFANCGDNLKKVALPPDMSMPKCTQAHKAFGWNHNLEEITGMETTDFSAVTTFQEMFCECRSLRKVGFRIDNWVTAKCTNIYSMFLQCQSLDWNGIGDFTTWDTSGITEASFAFIGTNCERLDLGGWDLRNCAAIQGIFADYYNNSYKDIDLSGWQLDLTKLTNHSDMFRFCHNLATLTLKGVTAELVQFFKTQLMADIPDRVKSGLLRLVLDDGTYKYDDTAGGWVAATDE